MNVLLRMKNCVSAERQDVRGAWEPWSGGVGGWLCVQAAELHSQLHSLNSPQFKQIC